MSKVEDWTSLEDEIESILKALQRGHSVAYQRFYDTKSAGNALPSQPADFLAAYMGRALFIEAKFSEVYTSLYSCFSNNVPPTQIASARIWKRAGIDYIFLFFSYVDDTVEVWDGIHCSEARSNGTRLDKKKKRNYQTIEQAIRAELMK